MPSSTIVFSVASNIVMSVVLVLINKQLVTSFNFRFMTVLTGLHFMVSFLSCLLLLLSGHLYYKPVRNYMSIFRISLGSLLSIVFMNYSLAFSSIGFYQISKLFCIPVTLIIESIFGIRQQAITTLLLVSLILIIIGMALIVEQEIIYNTTGVIWAFLAVIATSSAQIFFGPLKKGLGLDSLQLLLHTSPWLAFGAFVSVPLLENTKDLLLFELDAKFFIITLLASCLISFLFNTTNYVLLGLISPMSYTVLSHVKTVVIIVIGSYLFESMPTQRVLLGISIAMVGVGLYTVELNYQSKTSNSDSSVSSSGISSNSGSSSSSSSTIATVVTTVGTMLNSHGRSVDYKV